MIEFILHPQRGALPSELSVDGERRLRPRFSHTVVPGVLGGQPPGPLRGPGSMSLTPSRRGESRRREGKWGTKDLKTPQWSAVRRGRSGRIGPVLLRTGHGISLRLDGALLPLLGARRNTPERARSKKTLRGKPLARSKRLGCLTIGSGTMDELASSSAWRTVSSNSHLLEHHSRGGRQARPRLRAEAGKLTTTSSI